MTTAPAFAAVVFTVGTSLFASRMLASAAPETIEPADAFDPCRHQMHALVAYMQETALLENRSFTAEWRADGSVVVRCSGLVQYLWCQDEELHIHVGGRLPPALN